MAGEETFILEKSLVDINNVSRKDLILCDGYQEPGDSTNPSLYRGFAVPSPFWEQGDGMFTIPDFFKAKSEGRPLVMVTCYDAFSASILQATEIDAVLVGDSLAMVIHGHGSTLTATTSLMETHCRAVRSGGPDLCIVADMPFLATRRGLKSAVETAGRLMRAGANAVKIEGADGHEEIIPHLIGSGIPVMGHLGLTPQFVNLLGGYRVQGKDAAKAERILQAAQKLESLGCFALVLECVPEQLACNISNALTIPTIGIGAGSGTDGQILVLHDLLGLTPGKKPRFVRQYLEGARLMEQAVNTFASDAKARRFPSARESYGVRE
jgi:3-methyl-2-oxobutanoate hydroxymethyltransferase